MANSSAEMAIFQRVAERGSFAGAADDVGLSPSAVAKLVTRLETRLGVRLINRTTRRLSLTTEGEIYLEMRARFLLLLRPRKQRFHLHTLRRAGTCACTPSHSSPCVF